MNKIAYCTSEIRPDQECRRALKLVPLSEGSGFLPLCPHCDKQTLAFVDARAPR